MKAREKYPWGIFKYLMLFDRSNKNILVKLRSKRLNIITHHKTLFTDAHRNTKCQQYDVINEKISHRHDQEIHAGIIRRVSNFVFYCHQMDSFVVRSMNQFARKCGYLMFVLLSHCSTEKHRHSDNENP